MTRVHKLLYESGAPQQGAEQDKQFNTDTNEKIGGGDAEMTENLGDNDGNTNTVEEQVPASNILCPKLKETKCEILKPDVLDLHDSRASNNRDGICDQSEITGSCGTENNRGRTFKSREYLDSNHLPVQRIDAPLQSNFDDANSMKHINRYLLNSLANNSKNTTNCGNQAHNGPPLITSQDSKDQRQSLNGLLPPPPAHSNYTSAMPSVHYFATQTEYVPGCLSSQNHEIQEQMSNVANKRGSHTAIQTPLSQNASSVTAITTQQQRASQLPPYLQQSQVQPRGLPPSASQEYHIQHPQLQAVIPTLQHHHEPAPAATSSNVWRFDSSTIDQHMAATHPPGPGRGVVPRLRSSLDIPSYASGNTEALTTMPQSQMHQISTSYDQSFR